MTMTYCRGCGNDVHITHKDEDCPADNADLKTPDHLKASRIHEREVEEDPGSGW